jgi:hypothetical protein
MTAGDDRVPVALRRPMAELLARMCAELGSDDPALVVGRALGLLDLALRSQREGGRLCFVNQRGETADVVF